MLAAGDRDFSCGRSSRNSIEGDQNQHTFRGSGRAVVAQARARFVATLTLCALLAGCTGAAQGGAAMSDATAVDATSEGRSVEDGAAIAPADKANGGEVKMEAHMKIDIVDIVVPATVDASMSVPVPVRRYEPSMPELGEPWATLVWAHGGSFVHGDLDWPEADWVSQRFAEAGVRVYSVDYRLVSARVKAPIPSDDVAAVLRWAALEHSGPIVVGGASAGGQLAALAALAQAETATNVRGGSPEVRAANALILLYPTLHRVQQANSTLAAATAVLPEQRRFDAARVAEMYAFYLGEVGQGSAQDPRAAVIGELPVERLALLPPTVVVNADLDELRASGEQFAAQLRAAEVAVTVTTRPGTVHGYMNRPEESDAARADAHATVDLFVAELHGIVDAVAA